MRVVPFYQNYLFTMTHYKRIALFRYHNNLDGCINRLQLFAKINPEIDVYGLYGGKEDEFAVFEEGLKDYLKDNYCIRDKESEWKWLHGDLAFRLWYSDFGHSVEFDFVHILEWDLLYLAKIDALYDNITPNDLAITGLVDLNKIADEWFWIRDDEQSKKWEGLKDHVKNTLGYSGSYVGSVAPGLCMPKDFLEKYSNADVPELAHDELRLPLYAQAFGFNLVDTQYYRKWFSKREWKLFNCNEIDIELRRIKRNLKKKNGRRVFHPFRSIVDVDEMMLFLQKNNVI